MKYTNGNDKTKYITSRGYEVTFKGIPTLLQQLASQFPEPTPPTYEVPTATGGVEIHAHDETTLENDSDRAAWAEYKAALRTREEKMSAAHTRLILLEGIIVKGQPQSGWEKRQKFIGFEIPEDEVEREFHFKHTEVSASPDDIVAILAGVSRASGVDEANVLLLEDSFRRKMGGETAEGTTSTDSDDEKRVDVLSEVRANGHSNRTDAPGAVVVGQSGHGRQKRDRRILAHPVQDGNVGEVLHPTGND